MVRGHDGWEWADDYGERQHAESKQHDACLGPGVGEPGHGDMDGWGAPDERGDVDQQW